ncbi:DUF885 family protein [Modestobacter altitudinis]|uniref:DUF885 family protein n=1 Tax=Modestobacter altitudinis TaxID=2213158 RepID=UPI00110CC9B8|nr:DUF885 family protein [Modestobacter altitudinis]
MTDLETLAEQFWEWRSAQQPRSRDDIPRIGRPAGWLPDFSAGAVARYRRELDGFADRLARIDVGADRASAVDARLLRSALARVRWELDVLRSWQRDPGFYVDQTLGCVFDLLTPLGVDAARLADVRRVLAAIPALLDVGRENLAGEAVREFAGLAVTALTSVADDVAATVEALGALHPAGWSPDDDRALAVAGADAAQALAAFRDHLAEQLPGMAGAEPVGPHAFGWFLREVAVLPHTPAELLEIGRREAERAAVLELLERNRNGSAPGGRPVPRFTTGAEQADAQAAAELAVRRFHEDRGLLTQPDTLRHYRTHPMPAYLAPIAWCGVADDLTGPDRLEEDGSAFFPPPGPDLPYFYAANAHDPRAGIIHEGAHHQQLALSWRHPRAVRRHYYDSCANEGIAFYNEEMVLASGLFDDAPATREIVCNFMRLRALRVVVDVQLALGGLDIPAAAALLEDEVPMDRETALEEAAFFAATPGQAMTYQVGKTQVLGLLADASRQPGFSLRAFHDRLWREGNVPFALQRWELLDDRRDLDRIEELARLTA